MTDGRITNTMILGDRIRRERKPIVVLLALFLFLAVDASVASPNGNGQKKQAHPMDVPIDPDYRPWAQEDEDDKGEEEEEVDRPDPVEPPQEPEPPPPPPEMYGEELPTEEGIVYVIDRSGSMSARMSGSLNSDGSYQSRATRMEHAKHELKLSIRALSPQYEFNIVSYNCNITQLWQAPKEATQQNKQAAFNWIDGLHPSGRTGTGPATVVALEMDSDTVVLVTDGRPNCPYGIDEHLSMILDHAGGDRVNTIGISDYGDFAQFLREIASKTGGSYVHVD